MNTIHSSSLAAYPTGFIKPEQDSLAKSRAQTNKAENLTKDFERRLEAPASTPDQIKAALIESDREQSGMPMQNQDNKTRKALQAYSQAHEQLNQNKLEGLISRVDYYA